MTDKPTYCIDSSSLIEAWGYSYRPLSFPSFWERVEQLIKDGRLVMSEEVKYEVEKDANNLHGWVKDHDGLVMDFDHGQEEMVKQIMRDYPRLISLKKNKGWADPFIIALAHCKGYIIVTEEKWSTEPPRIPYVAKKLGVLSINLAEMIEREGWTF